jgi:hypothetical protein
MTTMFPKQVTCGVCGSISNVMEILSTNAFGSADLDTRPPEMRRSTLCHDVHRCPSCGYCAPDISTASSEVNAILQSAEYQIRLNDTTCPDKCNDFLCFALIAKAQGDISKAVWATVNAAWICDDEKNMDAAIYCRTLAISLIDEMRSRGLSLVEQRGTTEAVKTDLLRRAGCFPEALATIETGLGQDPEDIIKGVLLFQKKLVQARDITRHTISEALADTRIEE